jgi:thioesterase domain-containing protein
VNGNEVPHTSIKDMAAHYIQEIQRIEPEGPYYLAGYCLGAIIGFEMALQLSSQGKQIALLASLNGVSPNYENPDGVVEQNDIEENRTTSGNLREHWKKFLDLGTRRKLIYPVYLVLKKILSYNQQYAIRRAFYRYYISRNRPLPEILGETYFLETNADMAHAYKAQPYNGKMVILRSPGVYPDPSLGWGGLVHGEIETVDIPGKHPNRRTILNEPFVEKTAAALKKYLQ